MQKVAIVVPVFNAERTLEQCITALTNQDYPETCREIVMVDNNSTDRSAQIIHSNSSLRYLQEPKQGPAAARNHGAAAASHDLLVFTDSDCFPDPSWLRMLVSAFDEDPGLDMAGGEIIPASLERYVERKMWHQGLLVQQRMIQRRDPFPFCISANLAIRKEIFERLGGFSLDYPLASGEDMALGFELYRQGGHLGYVPDAIVRHHHRTSWRDLYRQFLRYGEGSAQFYSLNERYFSRNKVEKETNGIVSFRKDCYELSRVAKHWIIKTKGKNDSDAYRWEEILFAYCCDRGWNAGKRRWRRKNKGYASTSVPQSKEARQPRLCIMLTPCCWREYLVPFTALGKKLEERDYDVQYLFGHGGVCTFLGWVEGWTEKKCANQFENIRKQIDRPDACQVLSDGITDAMREEAERFIDKNRTTPFAEVFFEGLNVWEIVRGSICRDMRERFSLDEKCSIGNNPLLEKYTRAVVTCYRAISRYLDSVQPDAVMIFNGFFYQERLMCELAHDRGCRVVAHENSSFRDRKIFSKTGYVGNWTDPAAENRFRLRARVLTENQRDMVRAYMNDVFSGKVNTIGQASADSEEEVRRKLGIKDSQRIALLIGQVPFDVVMVYDLQVFNNMLEFILGTIKVFGDIPDYTLVVRLHPFEETIGGDRTWHQIKNLDMPANVRIVHSKEINTYSIMSIADFGIASTSQAALEMAAMHKPVILVGEAFFGGHGFTCDVSNIDAFESTIKMLCQNPVFTPRMERMLDRFLYHIIFEHQVKYDRDAWSFSPAAVNKIADMFGLPYRPTIEGEETKLFNRPSRSRHLQVPQTGQDLAGWCAMGASLERVDDGDGTRPSYVLCRTDAAGWSGVGFGCTKPNRCDNKTLPCKKQTKYYISVDVKALDGREGTPVQLHVIGTGAENFGSQRTVLTSEWTTLRHAVQTSSSCEHLGIQIVKVNHAQESVFAVANLVVESEFTWLELA